MGHHPEHNGDETGLPGLPPRSPPRVGPRMAGSLAGAAASQKVTEVRNVGEVQVFTYDKV